ERVDDSRAGGAVAAEVSLRVLDELELALLVLDDRDRPFEPADRRVAGLDAAVEDADADALAGRAAKGPIARDPLGPLDPDCDPTGRVGRQAPRGKPGVVILVVLVRRRGRRLVCHAVDRTPELYETRRRSSSSNGQVGSTPSARNALSRSAMSARRNSASASARATIPSSSRRACGNSCAAPTQAAGAGGSIPISRDSLSMSYALITSPAHLTCQRPDFFPRTHLDRKSTRLNSSH